MVTHEPPTTTLLLHPGLDLLHHGWRHHAALLLLAPHHVVVLVVRIRFPSLAAAVRVLLSTGVSAAKMSSYSGVNTDSGGSRKDGGSAGLPYPYLKINLLRN